MPNRLIPFPVHETSLPNGLRVIVVSTGFPSIVSLQIPVQTGSRNEVEPGKSGFAHFFEHMMFRGTERFSPDDYAAVVARAGARQNAYTTDDYTNYHITCAAEDLDAILEIEADRFRFLKYSEEAFRTESRAILGEYNKSASNPMTKLFEVQRDRAYSRHTYKHTTMGFLADIEDMPNQYDYSLEFFRRWYRPEFTTVLVAGDVQAEETVELIARHFGDWEPGAQAPPAIPAEPDPEGPVIAHVPWPAATLPWVSVAFHAPAWSAADPSHATLDMLFDLWFGETSDLHRQLVETEQIVDELMPYVPAAKDPPLATVLTRVKDPGDAPRVREALLETFARSRREPVTVKRLEDAKSYARYSILRSFDNSETVAGTLARFVQFDRSADAIESLFAQYDSITVDSLLETGERFFNERGLVQTTLATERAELGLERAPSLGTLRPQAAEDEGPPTLERRSASRQLIFKLRFRAGSAADPPGREGLASLAAAMVCDAGSEEMRFDEISRELFPMAGSFRATVDRDVTTFTGTIHADNFDRFASAVLPQLIKPGFRDDDFARLKSRQKNALVQDLCANNDEELGKEVLQSLAFPAGPYRHPVVGTASGIDAITMADVRGFIARSYSRVGLTVGLSGDFPTTAEARLRAALGRLPAGSAPEESPPEALPPVVPRRPSGLRVTLVEKETRSVAISLGHPIDVLRDHPDFPALWLARAALGDHRAFNGRLFQRVRELRGINYGDYAYIEAFPGGMYRFFPEAGRPRRAQLFEIWIRPVVPEQAVFALKLALHELDSFVSKGLTEEEFERTREYLMKNVYVMLQSQDSQLGYDLDGEWFGTGDFVDWMRPALAALTLDAVNAAVRRHLSARDLFAAMVTGNAGDLRAALLSKEPATMTYESQRDASLLAEDRIVGARDLGLGEESIEVVRAEEVWD